MIWIISGLLLGGAFLYLCLPLLATATDGDSGKSSNSPRPKSILLGLAILFSLGTIGLYMVLGRPDLTTPNSNPDLSAQPDTNRYSAAVGESQPSLAQLVDQLKLRLDSEPGNSDGWMLYARSLMNLGRFDEALQAYEKTLALSNNAPGVMQEFERAKTFIARRQSGGIGPTPAEVQAAAEMSPEDRNAMIKGMVDTLSSRLKADPNDPEGWVRLIRSRYVMGQADIAETEIGIMREAFHDRPDIIEMILSESALEQP